MKQLTSLCLLMLCALISSAQDTITKNQMPVKDLPASTDKGWYFQIGATYSLGIGRQYPMLMDTKDYFDSTDTHNDYEKTVKKNTSFGTGITFQYAFGYRFEQWNAQLLTGYMLGSKIETIGETISSFPSRPSQTVTKNYSVNVLNFNPSIGLHPFSRRKISAFLSVGAIIGVVPVLTIATKYTNAIYPISYKEHYHGNIAWGFSSCIGASYKLNTRFKLFAELRLQHETYSPARHDYQRLVTTQRTHFYDIPLPELQPTYNLSSVGLMVGISCKFE